MDTYYFLNACGTVAVFIYNLLHMKEQKEISTSRLRLWAERKKKSKDDKFWYNDQIWLVIEIVLISIFQYYLAGYANLPFGKLVGTGANYFGLLSATHLTMYIGCRVLKNDLMKQMDLVTPAYPLALVFVKSACFSEGCCRGFAWEHGIYYASRGITEFPAQLLEALMAFLIFLFLLKYKQKMKTGTVFPIYLTVYSAIRFFTEFTRGESVVMFGLKRYQYLCLIGVIVGVIEYCWVLKRYNNINNLTKGNIERE